ncbi:hypothetical protein AAH211_02280 [Serratia fonticola]|jgi:hypothetical protein|uniref:hypothetical protein n=1 Tax=Serratia fonticola TaxID=47917 RepID=UPI000FB9A6B1|nr:hypothetical protein [Serratia fonticola]MBC3230112.1 hypothetical protein [Serratia fonticola]CAI0850089.1 Uncharacterised protein [Serratia fonticola]
MATKDQIDAEKVRKEAIKKVGFLMKGLNKNRPGITEGSAAGAGATNSNLLAAMSVEWTFRAVPPF